MGRQERINPKRQQKISFADRHDPNKMRRIKKRTKVIQNIEV